MYTDDIVIGTPCYFRKIDNLDWAPKLHLKKQYNSYNNVISMLFIKHTKR